jgi:hypothetical protein
MLSLLNSLGLTTLVVTIFFDNGEEATMAERIEDITINYENESGEQVVKELDKEILTRGSWTTIMFMYQDLDPKTGRFGDPKVTIRRYRKSGTQFRQQSKFNITGRKQALKVARILSKWFGE